MNSPLIIRIVSALFLAPPLLWLLLAGSPFLLFLLAVPVAGLLVREWCALSEPFSLYRFMPVLVGVCLLLVSAVPPGEGAAQVGVSVGIPVGRLPLAVAVSLVLLIVFIDGLVRHRPGEPILAGMGWRFFGVMYCTLPLVLLLDVRRAEQGGLLICFLLLIIWATDVGAFFVGRRWGRRKLAPHISPGKTVAGLFGGLVLASVTGGGVSLAFSLPYGWLEATLLGAVLSVVGQLGDLAESLVKREVGVKDSGQLIPGHGGLLDRLDSLLFATPVYYLFLWMDAVIPPRF